MEQATGLRGGIDLGGTKIQAVIVGPDHVVLGQARHTTPLQGPAAVAAEMAETLREAASATTRSGSARSRCPPGAAP